MAEERGKYISVYLVDDHLTHPPQTPTVKVKQRCSGLELVLLFLVSLVLCGMIIQAFFIYRLYQPESTNSGSSSKLIGGEDEPMAKKWDRLIDPPSKPAAHLTDGLDVVLGSEILTWSLNGDPLLYKLDYSDGSLIIQTEGYYYVYSKVTFLDKSTFHHSVHRKTKLYTGKSIVLLESRMYSSRSGNIQSNSYLGGVFHLYKDDALFVKVSNTLQVVRHKHYENVFGAYMI
ncbi:tumor necrosis factor ligand superfamily member 14-like isoform X2 [Sphaeramia orbicularis]|uniref:tumor necrosis factor ligand superfamily member 14-like isoform X2 n=1 Tax=Sphaeramia orbicularis TaxID=375764 RepID=UPI00117D46B9|nr:tumor necrosis factor ligand superfamily member 14-like isoform X2 [Sphaeramia orbicularis]